MYLLHIYLIYRIKEQVINIEILNYISYFLNLFKFVMTIVSYFRRVKESNSSNLYKKCGIILFIFESQNQEAGEEIFMYLQQSNCDKIISKR